MYMYIYIYTDVRGKRETRGTQSSLHQLHVYVYVYHIYAKNVLIDAIIGIYTNIAVYIYNHEYMIYIYMCIYHICIMCMYIYI